MNDNDSILDHLRYAIRRDAIKGGIGCRDTVEIAEYQGCSVAKARGRLWMLADAGLIDCMGRIEGLGSALHWRLADQGEPGSEDEISLAA